MNTLKTSRFALLAFLLFACVSPPADPPCECPPEPPKESVEDTPADSDVPVVAPPANVDSDVVGA